MMGSFSRRDLLRSSVSVSSVFFFGTQFSASAQTVTSPTLDQFFALSQKLTGHASLDNDMGRSILDAFISSGHAEELAKLIAVSTPESSKLKIADAVVAAWYSGLSPLPGARQVTGFNEALVWNAMSFTKPWGNCGGEMGYWSEPPVGEEP